jgi:ParB family chromosome partitioning protein
MSATTSLKIDPEFMNILPRMNEAESALLKTSIQLYGCLDPIWTWNKIIIDGHTRYQMCLELGLPILSREVPNLCTRSDAKLWIIASQLGRRNLNQFTRVEIALKLKPEIAAAANARILHVNFKESLDNSEGIIPGERTRDVIARAAKVSARQVDKVERILESGNIELINCCRNGETSINKAELEINKNHCAIEFNYPFVEHEIERSCKSSTHHLTLRTKDFEWCTPAEFMNRVRGVLGTIDLDPASSQEANKIVLAKSIYTANEDGLTRDWYGNIWLNPPYTQPLLSRFVEKLVYSMFANHVKSAIVLTHNSSETKWFQTLLQVSKAVCFTKSRINFIHSSGKTGSPPQGQAFFYFGSNKEKFISEFYDAGVCLAPVKEPTGNLMGGAD